MGRKKGRRNLPPPVKANNNMNQLVSSFRKKASTEIDEDDKKKSVYGNKKVYVSFIRFLKPVRWIEVDPHCSGPLLRKDNVNHRYEEEDCFSVDLMPKINSPPTNFDVSRLMCYATLVFDSKLYFIGGRFIHEDDVDDSIEFDVFSDKIFIYNFFSHEWDESGTRLNIARSSPNVVIADNVLYVIGGTVDHKTHHITNKEHWIECFNLLDHGKKNLDYLPTASAPPDAVFADYYPLYQFVYEPGNQIVFVMPEAGTWSFNYISKTWALFRENVNKQVTVKCFEVVVIDRLLFWHYYGVIYAYDLMNNQLVLSQRLNHLKRSFRSERDRELNGAWPETNFLVRVGNDTLLLICWHSCDDLGKTLHFYKFQIENLTPEPPLGAEQVLYNNLRLVQIGCGCFPPPGDVLLDVVVV